MPAVACVPWRFKSCIKAFWSVIDGTDRVGITCQHFVGLDSLQLGAGPKCCGCTGYRGCPLVWWQRSLWCLDVWLSAFVACKNAIIMVKSNSESPILFRLLFWNFKTWDFCRAPTFGMYSKQDSFSTHLSDAAGVDSLFVWSRLGLSTHDFSPTRCQYMSKTRCQVNFLSSAFGRWIWLEDFLWSSLDLLLQDGMLGRWCWSQICSVFSPVTLT